MPLTRWLAEYAWLPEHAEPTPDVLIEAENGRITSVTPLVGAGPPAAGVEVLGDAVRLPGLTLPGLANAHSHAFHRALRGRTHGGRGDFWSWRDVMYTVAARLDPDSYLALARAAYAEMALAGITCVGEFHYLHHGPDGQPYDDPNAMSAALVEAAAHAGIRLTLLDACYLTSTVDGEPLTGPQRRFGDGNALRWADRVAAFRPEDDHARVGAAIHSVRAVPAEQLATVANLADRAGVPLHVHLSEQPAENDACRAVHGCTPTRLLADHGVLGRHTTAVHATHPTGADVALLGENRTGVCLCPTTERDLADGIGPARRMAEAGSPLSLGSDSHAVIDLFEEARAVELDERLRTRRRGHFTAVELVTAATIDGHAALGWGDAGRLSVGDRADLVTVRLDSARTAGVPPVGAFFAATAADVTHVVVDGRTVVADGRHLTVDVPTELHAAIEAVTS
ncbi:formiminoglutamate deiminase [Micromonospora eburnea]|uniref:Formiminoglutamate deiminase n=1 Tax=Micromonospora eburnea TaxID=227316 RepID=A0A1C6TVK9_9ACTN|nr:formiminoglutamate deiminase [Micromonospora eburnea]